MLNNTGTIILSILIPTIPERKKRFKKLWRKLCEQGHYCRKTHPTLGDFEFLFDDSKTFRSGGMSIGEKRQALLDNAHGKYLCFLDDDESISPDYLETLLRLCTQDKDVCVFRSLAKLSNNWALVEMKIGNPNEQINSEGITRRPPWHICPVRRTIAQEYKFDASNYGEDWDWFTKVYTRLNSEAISKKIIHQYNHGAHSEADKIKP